MKHGHHFGIGFYGPYILAFLLIIFILLVYLIIRKKHSPNPFVIKLIELLRINYASGVITVDEFLERKNIIQNLNYTNSSIPMLIEKYAKCEIDTNEFTDIKNKIEENKIDNDTIIKLIKGELSYEEFKKSSD